MQRGLATKKLAVVRLSVKCVDCDKVEEKAVHILYHSKDHLF